MSNFLQPKIQTMKESYYSLSDLDHAPERVVTKKRLVAVVGKLVSVHLNPVVVRTKCRGLNN